MTVLALSHLASGPAVLNTPVTIQTPKLSSIGSKQWTRMSYHFETPGTSGTSYQAHLDVNGLNWLLYQAGVLPYRKLHSNLDSHHQSIT